jgi:hypothetical protein
MSLSDFPDNTTSIVVTVVILVLVVLLLLLMLMFRLCLLFVGVMMLRVLRGESVKLI